MQCFFWKPDKFFNEGLTKFSFWFTLIWDGVLHGPMMTALAIILLESLKQAPELEVHTTTRQQNLIFK